MVTLDQIILYFFNNFKTQRDVDNFVKWIYELDKYGDYPYKGKGGSTLPLLLEDYLCEDWEVIDGIPITRWYTREGEYEVDIENPWGVEWEREDA